MKEKFDSYNYYTKKEKIQRSIMGFLTIILLYFFFFDVFYYIKNIIGLDFKPSHEIIVEFMKLMISLILLIMSFLFISTPFFLFIWIKYSIYSKVVRLEFKEKIRKEIVLKKNKDNMFLHTNRKG